MAGGPTKKAEEKSKGVVDDLSQFAKDSRVFFEKCTRPDMAEYKKIL